MVPHLSKMSGDYEIDVVQNGGRLDILPCVNVIHVPIARRISPMKDLLALLLLIRVFRRNRYQVVHSVTPKAGLLAMLAARMTLVPNRFHWFTGQVWSTRVGFRRKFLKYLDQFIAECATKCLVDGRSQAAFLVSEGVLSECAYEVLGEGSICGVDTERFRRVASAHRRHRLELGIPESSTVILFLGRLTVEKGVLDLAKAFSQLKSDRECHLVYVGPDEGELAAKILTEADHRAQFVKILGSRENPEDYLSAADIFCLPSHREGFGLSVIEAASCQLPAVVSDVYGLRDAIIESETGLKFPVHNWEILRDQLRALVDNPELRLRMGAAARSRVISKFGQEVLTDALSDFYSRQLKKSL